MPKHEPMDGEPNHFGFRSFITIYGKILYPETFLFLSLILFLYHYQILHLFSLATSLIDKIYSTQNYMEYI